MVLNTFGKIVEYHWQRIPNHFNHVELDEFVIMPNHIHGILVITGRDTDVGAKHSISDHSINNVEADKNASPLQMPQQSPPLVTKAPNLVPFLQLSKIIRR